MPYKDREKAAASKRKYYESNRQLYRDRASAFKKQLQLIVVEAKSSPCLDCKKAYPYYVMDFDHREGEEKSANVSLYLRNGQKAKLLDEIAKCEVVCSNCHRERTARRAGYQI